MPPHSNGRQQIYYGDLDPLLVAMALGVDWKNPGQAADPAFKKVARLLAVAPGSTMRALAHRMDNPACMAEMMVKSFEMLAQAPDSVRRLDGFPRVAHRIIAENELWTPWETVKAQRLKGLDARTAALEVERAFRGAM